MAYYLRLGEYVAFLVRGMRARKASAPPPAIANDDEVDFGKCGI